jgi:hypothetical protein
VLEREIIDFLERYGDAFNRVAADEIAEMYYLPSLTVRGDGSVHVFTEVADVRDFMGSVAKVYYDEGNRASSFDELSVRPVGGQSAVASLRWMLRREDGTSIREWRQTYNLVRSKGSWKFILSTFHRP